MKLEETSYDNSETGCCARLDRATWDGRTFDWQDKPFLKRRVRSFCYIPLDFGGGMQKLDAAVRQADAFTDPPLWLSDTHSPWSFDLLPAVDRDVPGETPTTISGFYLATVFAGAYREAGEWVKQSEAAVAAAGGNPGKTYIYYATCPKCSKTFGTNHAVVFTEKR